MKEELEIKDVMIGAWVDVRNNADPNTPHLERITPSHFLRDEHWYGVELVPEILEKNGFEYKEPILTTFSEEKVWQIKDSNKQILIEIEEQTDDNLVVFYVGRFIHGCNNCELFIKHIHQLQHALKLCKIDKEIVL